MKMIRILLLATISGHAANAAAAYYIEEDIPPAVISNISRINPAAERWQPPPTSNRNDIGIPFCTDKTTTGPIATGILRNLVPQLMQAHEIIVQGRPDQITKNNNLAHSRSIFIKEFLIKNGIPSHKINISTLMDYKPSPYQTCSESTIIYAANTPGYTPGYASAPARQPPRQNTSAYYPPVAETRATPIDAMPMSTIRRIFTLGNIASLSTADTLKLIENVYANKVAGNPNNDEQIIISLIAPQITPDTTFGSPSLYVTNPSLVNKGSWVLDKNLTLKDNVDNWSRLAGWNPSVWNASNYYQITTTSTLDGDFPEILRQVAESTKLNICAKRREKYVRVTDPDVSCKN